jgi:hypothetical protein
MDSINDRNIRAGSNTLLITRPPKEVLNVIAISMLASNYY